MNSRLIVSGRLLPGLLLKTEALIERIVQLSVRVGNFLLADECLESLAKALVVLLANRLHTNDSGRQYIPFFDR